MKPHPSARIPLTGLVNAFTLPASDSSADSSGWACIPYGEWPHAQGLQRFGRAEADAMVGYFKNTWNRIKRAVVGMPVFRGHPDLPAAAAQYPDRTVYGTVADLEARDDGLYLRPVLSAAGAALVNEQGLAFFSPHWLAQRLPDEDGRAVFAPALLVSIGLTDRPNITGTSLVNTEPEPTTLANETAARTAAETRVAELTAQLSALHTQLAIATAAHAVATGRITEAEQTAWRDRLTADFTTASAALANERPGAALKLAARTRDLGARKPAGPASDRFIALVNDRTAKGEPWESAWAAVKATAEGRALFEQMGTPCHPL
ncbi:MAG: hypothetical protein NTV51_19415 [Verrucomicrobia bacterium]|nr:hypothetical protein [Verrucomicrobiota bacterium]